MLHTKICLSVYTVHHTPSCKQKLNCHVDVLCVDAFSLSVIREC